MARLNVWVPDELAARARAGGLNVSALTQAALAAELARHTTDAWLARLPAARGPQRTPVGITQEGAEREGVDPEGVDHEAVIAALDDARGEFASHPTLDFDEPAGEPGQEPEGGSGRRSR